VTDHIGRNSEILRAAPTDSAAFVFFNLPFDTATIVLGSAILSALFAFFSIRSAREISRKNATLNMIEKVEATAHYRQLYSTFSYYKRLGSFDRLYDPTEQKDKSDRQDVIDFLNHYELVAIGIEKKVLDAGIYRFWMRGPFVSHWNAAAPLINRIRWKYDSDTKTWSYYAEAFAAYQRVALRFSPEAKDLTEKSSDPPETPQGPSDDPIPVPPPEEDSGTKWFKRRNSRRWL